MANDPNRLAGVASITLDGRAYNIAGEGTYRCSGTKRESLVGQDGYHGYSEMPQPGKISWKGRDSGTMSLAALNEAASITVVLVLANGKTVIGSKMTRVGDPLEASTEDATFTVEFEGGDVSEVAA